MCEGERENPIELEMHELIERFTLIQQFHLFDIDGQWIDICRKKKV